MIKLEVNSNVSVCISEPNELLELMSGEDKLKLVESLSCHDEVIEHVVSQISSLYGCTENGHSGWSSGVLGSCLLDKVRINIAKAHDDLAREVINSLMSDIKQKQTTIDELYEENATLKGF